MTFHSRPASKTRASVTTLEGSVSRLPHNDELATEEPMEIRLVSAAGTETVAVTMRTPGADFELAAGLLYSDGVVTAQKQIRAVRYCVDRDVDADQKYNVVSVELGPEISPDLSSLERRSYISSACGVCGKASLEALRLRQHTPLQPGLTVSVETIYSLPVRLRQSQGLFDATGGLHAAALFDREGGLLAVREDVGRHNAVDKLIGWALLEGRLPLEQAILMVSGRSSFEIMQKALTARIPIVCAVSAPSSLAVDLALEFDITLVGFLRGRHANIYAGLGRICMDGAAPG
jgi:FdhD protein